MKPVILLDMDDVIVDLLPTWLSKYNEIYEDNMTMGVFCKDWNISKRVKCGEKIFEIIKQQNFFDDLPPISGALDGVGFLNERSDLYLVTNASSNGNIATGKLKWIDKNLPFFDKNKVFMCKNKELVRGDALIDDNAEGLCRWKARNPFGMAVLFSSYHNTNVESFDYVRAKSWCCVVSLLSGIIKN